MGTITAQAIAGRAWTVLQDTTGAQGVRWPEAEILNWINAAQREVVLVLPSSYTASGIVTLAQNTRQTLTAMGLTRGLQIIRLVRNFAADGTTPGRAITKASMAVLDQEKPDWHSESGPAVMHYMTDPQIPQECYIWPRPNAANLRAEVIYSTTPADLTNISQAITVDDIYANPIEYYVLFRALSKRTSTTGAAKQESSYYYNLFLQALGIKAKVMMETDAQQTAKQAEA